MGWDPLDLVAYGTCAPRSCVPLDNIPFLHALAHGRHRLVGLTSAGDVFQARLTGLDAENVYFRDVRVRSVDGDVQHLDGEAWARDELVRLTVGLGEWDVAQAGMLVGRVGDIDMKGRVLGREV